jgi:hypothetical protein
VYAGYSPLNRRSHPPHRADGALSPRAWRGAQRSAGRARRSGRSASRARGFAVLGSSAGRARGDGDSRRKAHRGERRIAMRHLGTLISRKRLLHPGARGISRRFTISMSSRTRRLTSSLANSTSDAIQRPPWSGFPVSRPSTLGFSGKQYLGKWPLGSSDESLITSIGATSRGAGANPRGTGFFGKA